jgi:hypothetical protein
MTHHNRMRHQMHDAWPALGSWQVQLTKGNVRIGDAERDDAAQALGEHFAVGRLDREEYDERMDVVLAARTWGDLAPVFRDLPSPTASAPRPVSAPQTRHRGHFRPPFLPVLLILIGVSVLVGSWWVFWIGLAGFLIARRASRRSRYNSAYDYNSGSWRPPRGSCS